MGDGRITGLHHVSLSVSDLDASTAWYESLFDLEVVMDEDDDARRARVYRLPGTDAMLGLCQHATNDGGTFEYDRTGLDHAAFAVASRDDVTDWASRLDAAGIENSGSIDIPIGAILNFKDPDGIALSIYFEGD